MKARLIAIAIFLGLAGGVGTGVFFVNWNTGVEDTTLPDSFGGLENYDKSRCTSVACTSPEAIVNCDAARRHLDDAGFTNAVLRETSCPFRIGPRAIALGADAGFAFALGTDGGIAKYQQISVVTMRRPADGGGFVYAVATKDNGWPLEATILGTFPCAWKPTAGAACTTLDGGDPGIENTMSAWAGAECVRKACVEVAGESSTP